MPSVFRFQNMDKRMSSTEQRGSLGGVTLNSNDQIAPRLEGQERSCAGGYESFCAHKSMGAPTLSLRHMRPLQPHASGVCVCVCVCV